MKFDIDISAVAGDQAVGRVFGSIALIETPFVGSRIDLSGSGHDFPFGFRYSPQFEVQDVIYFPVVDGVERSTLLVLSDLCLNTVDEVVVVTKYLTMQYGLNFDEFY